MDRRLELLSIALFAVNAGVVGGVLACAGDPTRGGRRRFARRNSVALCASGRRSDGNEPKLNYKGGCGARACGSSLASRRGLAELQ
jgi:hypothetical protein